MIKLIVQYENHSGPSAVGDHKIKFSIQKEFAPLLYKHLEELEKSPQAIMYLELADNKDESNGLLNETLDQKWNRYNKKIHALFDRLAEYKKVTSKEIKETIKGQLIKRKKIKKSLTELTTDDQLDVINKLEELLPKEENESD